MPTATNRRNYSYRNERVISGIGAVILAVYALAIARNQWNCGLDTLGVSLGSAAGLLALIAGWFALRGHSAESRARIWPGMKWGFIVGWIGFAAGFFGPMLFAPGASQGPLLGILVTGPLGFVVGALAGWVVAGVRAAMRR